MFVGRCRRQKGPKPQCDNPTNPYRRCLSPSKNKTIDQGVLQGENCAIGRIAGSDLGVGGAKAFGGFDAPLMPSIVCGNAHTAVGAVAKTVAGLLIENGPKGVQSIGGVESKEGLRGSLGLKSYASHLAV